MSKLKSLIKHILKRPFRFMFAPLEQSIKVLQLENEELRHCNNDRLSEIQELRSWSTDRMNEIRSLGTNADAIAQEMRRNDSNRFAEINELRSWNSDRMSEIQQLQLWNGNRINEINEIRSWNTDRMNEIRALKINADAIAQEMRQNNSNRLVEINELRSWNSDRMNEIHDLQENEKNQWNWNENIENIIRKIQIETQTDFRNLNSDLSKILCPAFQKEILQSARKKVSDGKKIRVGFFVVWASQFTTKRIYKLMKEDDRFEPIIIVNKIPSENDPARYTGVYEKTIEDLKAEGFDFVTNFDGENYIDFSDKIDVGIYHMLNFWIYHHLFSPQYLFSRKVLLYYTSYSMRVSASTLWEIKEGSSRYYLQNYIYKEYVDNRFSFEEQEKENDVCLGYPKIDELAMKVTQKREKPLIIMAPHQDINHYCFMGNFFNTKEIYTELPKLFPDVEFAFRPHPLWLSNLQIEWGKEKANAYFEKVLKNKNVYYSTESDYYQLWADSSAMIHDCGSFLAEYLFTQKPVMFLQDDMELNKKGLNVCGQKCVEHCYLGHTLDEAIKFVQKVVLEGNDSMKNAREKFVREELQVNYPHSSEAIIDDIKTDLGMRT